MGESTNKEHALDMMIDTAVKAGCTALTDIRVSTHIPKFNNSIIFIIKGIPAIGTKVDLNKYIEQENQARSTRNPKTVSAGIKAEMPETPDASHPEKTKIVEKERICIPKEKIRKFSPNIARRILQRTIFSVVMLLLLPVLDICSQNCHLNLSLRKLLRTMSYYYGHDTCLSIELGKLSSR